MGIQLHNAGDDPDSPQDVAQLLGKFLGAAGNELGEYREKAVVRSYKWRGKTILVEDVPALVCDHCGDILIREETVAAIDELLEKEAQPQEYAPIYRFPTTEFY